MAPSVDSWKNEDESEAWSFLRSHRFVCRVHLAESGTCKRLTIPGWTEDRVCDIIGVIGHIQLLACERLGTPATFVTRSVRGAYSKGKERMKKASDIGFSLSGCCSNQFFFATNQDLASPEIDFGMFRAVQMPSRPLRSATGH